MYRLLLFSISVLLAACTSRAAFLTVSGTTHHLGIAGRPEWDFFEGKTPEADKLRLSFQSHPNEREHTLFIRQDDVKQEWSVTLNGKKLGQLFQMEADLVHTLP